MSGAFRKFVWIVGIEDPLRGREGGSIAEVSAAHAGLLLHAKSHRIAAEDEIGAHKAGEGSAKRSAFEERLRKRGIAVVPVRGE